MIFKILYFSSIAEHLLGFLRMRMSTAIFHSRLSLSEHQSQSFNPIFKRFSNPAMHALLSLSSFHMKSAFVNFPPQISLPRRRNKNFEDYNLISGTTKSFSAFRPTPNPSESLARSLSIQTMIEFLICFRKFILVVLPKVDEISFGGEISCISFRNH